ncbi:hypothetical protein ANCCAN_00905 [Ancylostoma caninum]|uniref:Uncharacterized protein n=1 Tax=Ancylostoma caninum TaxID=29170 RepID=A0A368HBY3_ANCCA|nr:hypothetical protein ANCCAN_00905 [Ancylostoma caninum]
MNVGSDAVLVDMEATHTADMVAAGVASPHMGVTIHNTEDGDGARSNNEFASCCKYVYFL